MINGPTQPQAKFFLPFHKPNAYGQAPFNPPTAAWKPFLNPMMGPAQLTEEPASAETLPVNLQVQTPAQNDDLQKKHPGLYARLAKNQMLADLTPDLVGVGKTLGQVAGQKPVRDSQLADLDDNMKRFGSLAIASLATLGLKQRILGVGEYVGFASWFAAMAATPTVINNMVRLKTGLNLGQKYDSTYGERLNLFKDPNYLPLHILPKETMDQLARRLKIAPGPNQRQETEEKMRQISVQTHTWWMLAAGPATPVISGLVADNLKDPVVRVYNKMARKYSGWQARNAMNQNDIKVLENRLDQYLDRLVGSLPESELTSWWQNFGEEIVTQTHLRDALSRKDVMNSSDDRLAEKITEYFTHQNQSQGLSHPLRESSVADTLKYLDRQYTLKKVRKMKGLKEIPEGKLGNLQDQALSFLKLFKKQFEGEYNAAKAANDHVKMGQIQQRLDLLKEKAAKVKLSVMNATSTVEHYRGLLTEAHKTFESQFTQVAPDKLDDTKRKQLQDIQAKIQQKLSNSTLTDFMTQKQNGHSAELVNKANSAIYKLESSLAANRSKDAHKVLGANPQQHLIRVLKDVKARALWRNRVVYGLGGALTLASAVYTVFFVGLNFKKAPHPQTNGAQPGGAPQ